MFPESVSLSLRYMCLQLEQAYYIRFLLYWGCFFFDNSAQILFQFYSSVLGYIAHGKLSFCTRDDLTWEQSSCMGTTLHGIVFSLEDDSTIRLVFSHGDKFAYKWSSIYTESSRRVVSHIYIFRSWIYETMDYLMWYPNKCSFYSMCFFTHCL